VGLVLGALVLGGAAYAAISPLGQHHGSPDAKSGGAQPSGAARQRTGAAAGTGTVNGGSSGTGAASTAPVPARPGTAKDTEAHCRAYEHVRDKGQTLDATAWRRLVAAAGGAHKVAEYCAALEQERAGAQDNGGQDSGGQDSGGQDSGGQNDTAHDDAAQSSGTQNSGTQNDGGQSDGAQDSVSASPSSSADETNGGRSSGGNTGGTATR
jgi:hypothetical protein